MDWGRGENYHTPINVSGIGRDYLLLSGCSLECLVLGEFAIHCPSSKLTIHQENPPEKDVQEILFCFKYI